MSMDLLEECCNSRELWDETLLCIQHAIIATDVGGKILFCGPSVEKVLGFSPRELTGKDFSTVLTSIPICYTSCGTTVSSKGS